MITPDREINPPDDDKYQTCIVCKGKGRIITWDDDEGEQTPDYEKCSDCDGEGVVKIEPWEEEW